jgi:hypothetical protein
LLSGVTEIIQRGTLHLKHPAASLLILCVLFSGQSSAQTVRRTPEQQPTNAEQNEAQDLATKFTLRFTESQDLTPLIKDLYFADFVERYKAFKSKSLNSTKPIDLYFAPGLEYNSQLLTTADAKDWQDFYVATNNFLLLGFIAGLQAYSDGTREVNVSDIYPAEVIDLLHTNPTLANMLVRKGPGKAVGTVEEMRAATATLSQAVTMIREKSKGRPLTISNKDELTRVMTQDDYFKPRLEVLNEDFFGFPKNTRVLFMNTPVGLRLMLAKDADRLKILWTEIIAD